MRISDWSSDVCSSDLGGMGEVYAAHRSDRMFDQQVAIKLLRPESVAHSELFDRERRLLAGLEHPGIARLIDGGVAPAGRPYIDRKSTRLNYCHSCASRMPSSARKNHNINQQTM